MFRIESQNSGIVRSTLMRVLYCATVGCFLLVLFGVLQSAYRGFVVVPRLQKSFGFTASDTYLSSGGPMVGQYAHIQSIEPGGLFDRAGFHTGDIVVSHSYPAFFDALNGADSVDFCVGIADRPLDISELAVRKIKLEAEK